MTSGSGPTPASSRPRAARPSTAGTATTGAAGSATTTRPGPGTFVLADPDLRRNPSFAPPDPRKHLEPDTRLYPVSRTAPRFNDPGAANRVTSANSPTPYRDDLFGPHFEIEPVRQRAGA